MVVRNQCVEAVFPFITNFGLILIHSRFGGGVWMTPIGQGLAVRADGADLLRKTETRKSREMPLNCLLESKTRLASRTWNISRTSMSQRSTRKKHTHLLSISKNTSSSYITNLRRTHLSSANWKLIKSTPPMSRMVSRRTGIVRSSQIAYLLPVTTPRSYV